MKQKNYILITLFIISNIVTCKLYAYVPYVNFEQLLNISSYSENNKILLQKSILFKNKNITNTSLISGNSWIGNYYVSIAHTNYLTIAYNTVTYLDEMGVSLDFTSTVYVKGGDSALENMGDVFYKISYKELNNNSNNSILDLV